MAMAIEMSAEGMSRPGSSAQDMGMILGCQVQTMSKGGQRQQQCRYHARSPAPKDVNPSHDQSLQTKDLFSIRFR